MMDFFLETLGLKRDDRKWKDLYDGGSVIEDDSDDEDNDNPRDRRTTLDEEDVDFMRDLEEEDDEGEEDVFVIMNPKNEELGKVVQAIDKELAVGHVASTADSFLDQSKKREERVFVVLLTCGMLMDATCLAHLARAMEQNLCEEASVICVEVKGSKHELKDITDRKHLHQFMPADVLTQVEKDSGITPKRVKACVSALALTPHVLQLDFTSPTLEDQIQNLAQFVKSNGFEALDKSKISQRDSSVRRVLHRLSHALKKRVSVGKK